MYVNADCVSGAHSKESRAVGPPELELWMVIGHHVGAGG